MAFLAFGDVIAGEYQIIDDGVGAGPGFKEIVPFEKRVVAVAGMSNHQGLHGHGVFFHEVGDAGIGIDD